MKKKTKVFLIAATLVLVAAMCLSCAIPIPLLMPFADDGEALIPDVVLV